MTTPILTTTCTWPKIICPHCGGEFTNYSIKSFNEFDSMECECCGKTIHVAEVETKLRLTSEPE